MMNFRLLKVAIVQILTITVLIAIALFIYAFYAEHSAEKKALTFCGTVKTGTPVEGLLERAMDSGADQRMTRWVSLNNEPDWLPVTFTGALPLSRHICSVKAVDGKAIDVAYAYLN